MYQDEQNNQRKKSPIKSSFFRKIGGKGAKKAAGAAGRLLKLIVHALISFIMKIFAIGLPAFLIIAAVFATAFFIKFEFRGAEQEYDFRDPNELEQIEDEKDRVNLVAEEINEENEIRRDFYKYFSGISYWQINTKEKQDKLIGPYHKDAVKDFFGREKQFQLHPNFLYMLDEYAFDNKWQFPEQFIKPVAYEYNPDGVESDPNDYKDVGKDDDKKESADNPTANQTGEEKKKTLKLKPILDKSGEIIIESHKRDPDTYKELEDKEKSVSDYGLGTIFKYKEMNRAKVQSGVYIAKDVYNPATKQVEKKQIDEAYEFDLPLDDPEPKYIIDELICLTGYMRFNYEEGRQLQEGVNEGESTNEKDNVQKIKYDEAIIEEINEEQTKELGYPVKTITKIPLYKYRDTNLSGIYNVMDVPTEPDKEDYGFKYYIDYLDVFKAYIPGKVELDMSDRIDKKELKKIIEAEKEGSDAENLGHKSADFGSMAVGSKTESTSFKNAMQYFSLAQKYGNQYGFDPYLIVAMMAQESGGNANAKGGGILQIQDKTTTYNRDDGTKETYTANPYDVESSIKYIAMRMGNNLKKYKGDYMLTMFSYNMGEGTANYILKNHPEEYKNGTWMDYREEARAHMAAKSGYAGRKSASQHCIPQGKAQGSGGLWGDTCYIENVLRYYAGNGAAASGPTTSGSGGIAQQGQEGSLLNSQTGQAQTGGGNTGGILNSIVGKITNATKFVGSKLIRGVESFVSKFKDFWDDFVPDYEEEEFPCFEFKKSLNAKETEDIRKMAKTYSTMELFSEIGVEDKEEAETMMDDGFFENYTGMDASMSGMFGGGFGGSGAGEYGEFCGYGGYVPPLSGSLPISSPFGWRVHPIKKTRKHHDGVDIPKPKGTPVMASKSGKVSYASVMGGYGKVIFVDHGNGEQTRYAHLNEILVSVGQQVETGQIIGKVGTTGMSTGNHLHFELRVNGALKDPTAIVKGQKKGPAPAEGSMGCGQGKMATGTMESPDGGKMPKGAGQVIQAGQSKIGKPYLWGAKGPNAFDCSGFVYYTFKQVGVTVPSSTESWRTSGLMKPKNRVNLQPGDVFLLNTTRPLGHVGIYIGNGKMVHASSHYGQVRVDSIDTGYYAGRVSYNHVYTPNFSK